ncbi:MAG: DNA adenine methylase [Minwuiales bacterium]|nr:DNA adenine methylase [Minwuiales bacterium]
MIASPLRYPGGKAKLYDFFTAIVKTNNLYTYEYCEPYAGGAGLALRLLCNGFVERVSLNDVDRAVFAFWTSILNKTDAFCRLIEATPITVEEWYRQKTTWMQGDLGDSLALGFSAYFLNRTNRSGIIEGAGPIGGYEQNGKWKIDVRLDKEKQISNIQAVSRYSGQIHISNMDALHYIRLNINKREKFLYLDPPYYVKGKKLYKNFYSHYDHERIAAELQKRRHSKWVVSYDDVREIRDIYRAFSPITYSLNYSAGKKAAGQEVIFHSDSITLPNVNGFAIAA